MPTMGTAGRRAKLLGALDSPLSLIVLEGVPGAGKRTLLQQWSSAEGVGRRVVVPVPAKASLMLVMRLLWGVLRPDGGRVVDDDQLLSELRTELADGQRPVAIALVDADQLDHEVIEELLSLLARSERLQLIFALSDGNQLIEAAMRHDLPWARLDDLDLAFTGGEIADVLASSGFDPDQGLVGAILAATQGHPGMAAAAIATFPTEAALRTLTSGQALAAFLARSGDSGWPGGLLRFIVLLCGVPRFSVATAKLVAQDERAAAHLDRLKRLNAGTMTRGSDLQRYFCWDESVRLVIQRHLDEQIDPNPQLWRRIVAAAEETGDHELVVAGLVAQGELAEAERYVRAWLWDVLPDEPAPVWQPLRELGAGVLAEYPSLLCVRQRAGRGALSPASASRTARQLVASAVREPQQRIAALARGLELARQGGDPTVARRILGRARELVGEMPLTEPPGPGAVSDLLLLTQAALQLGSTSSAEGFAQRALALIDSDRRLLDPSGTRQEFAAWATVFVSRELGWKDPAHNGPMVLDGVGSSREAVVVTSNLAAMWQALDSGDLAAAEARTRLAMERVARLADWPVLLFYRALTLLLLGRQDELEVLRRGYARARQWTKPPEPVVSTRPPRAVDALIRRVFGQYLGLPGWLADELPNVEAGSDAGPRVRSGTRLIEALELLRADRLEAARDALGRAIAEVPGHGLAPVCLAIAGSAEIRALGDLIAGHPRADVLHLAQALSYRRMAPPAAVELTHREQEILALMRRGLTNKEMAEELVLSVNTVKFHRGKLLRKLDATSGVEALETATAWGL